MRFFEGVRPQLYINSVKLRRDKKTGKRIWGFNLIVTFGVQLAETCDVSIAKAWQYITEGDSCAVEVKLVGQVLSCIIDFFANVDDATPVLHMEGVDLDGMRLLRDGNVVELWFAGEHENNAGLHAFMKEYAYTRCWAAFKQRQAELGMKTEHSPAVSELVQAMDDLTEPIRAGVVSSMTIEIPGHEPTVITRNGAERIHDSAKEIGNDDPLLEDAIKLVFENGKASTSLLQRRLRIGYSRASGMLDAMERRGIIGAATSLTGPRELLSQE